MLLWGYSLNDLFYIGEDKRAFVFSLNQDVQLD